MAAIVGWYNSQNAPWNYARRLRAPASLTRPEPNTNRGSAVPRNPNDHVALNMADIATSNSNLPKDKENKDTLFGPSIGRVAPAPNWCRDPDTDNRSTDKFLDEKSSGKAEGDELTPNIVKEWIRRSADSSEPTTTLQALVNLKRPTIRLSPLVRSELQSLSVSADTNALTQQHGLEFELDCDAPRCGISLTVVGVPAHYADDHPQHGQSVKVENEHDKHLMLYETVIRGGFGRKLQLSDGAVLELAKLESAAQHARIAAAGAASSVSDPALPNNESGRMKANSNAELDSATRTADHPQRRFRFFRRRSHAGAASAAGNNSSSNEVGNRPVSTAGPALAVVDEEATRHREQQNRVQIVASSGADAAATEHGAPNLVTKPKDEEGAKVLIRLRALDAEGSPLRVRNEQVTYLHIVRHRPAPSLTSATASATAGEIRESIESDDESVTGAGANDLVRLGSRSHADASAGTLEDARTWVVKVVKREARIGQHTFQLHEIYGLSAHTVDSSASAPSEPVSPEHPHTYPPKSNLPTHNAVDDAPGASECLLCLSSPREVVLLPCRHLVACRECAVNMVEFGAGGPVTHNDPPAAAVYTSASPRANANQTGNNNAGETSVINQAPPPAPTTTRRKRKAKGWFCPVCRQPYTALLRITTAPPPSKASIGSTTSSMGGAHGDDERKSEIPESLGEKKHVSLISNRLSTIGSDADSDVVLNRLPSLSLGSLTGLSSGAEVGAVLSADRDLERGL